MPMSAAAKEACMDWNWKVAVARWCGRALATLTVGALLGFVPAVASAQIADAVIEVIAVDESQAVLPGVTVTVGVGGIDVVVRAMRAGARSRIMSTMQI